MQLEYLVPFTVRSRCAVLNDRFASHTQEVSVALLCAHSSPTRLPLAGAAAAAAESSSERETSDSEADASGETEEGAEEEDAGADEDAHL
jgi:hypothetical protein